MGLLVVAFVSNSFGQLSLGYAFLGFAVTALVIWSFAELLSKSRE
ncbi:MAG TPA: hypothetical protein VLX56_02420 [Nitrososphaerales archaeon]|nr:hypothetical protein [Nitrososphaerales archaeon]